MYLLVDLLRRLRRRSSAPGGRNRASGRVRCVRENAGFPCGDRNPQSRSSATGNSAAISMPLHHGGTFGDTRQRRREQETGRRGRSPRTAVDLRDALGSSRLADAHGAPRGAGTAGTRDDDRDRHGRPEAEQGSGWLRDTRCVINRTLTYSAAAGRADDSRLPAAAVYREPPRVRPGSREGGSFGRPLLMSASRILSLEAVALQLHDQRRRQREQRLVALDDQPR